MMTIQINYRGHEIRASREKSLGGDTLLYYSVIRESDGYICVDGFESGDETEGGMAAMLRKDVDAALASIDPWDEQYDREVTR